jgi:hypothetical protein
MNRFCTNIVGLAIVIGSAIVASISVPAFAEAPDRDECRQYIPLESMAGTGVSPQFTDPKMAANPMYRYEECLKKHQQEENHQNDQKIEQDSQ